MPASNRKQLSIRSDEAYRIAHDLAEKLGATTTEVVEMALRELKSRRSIPSRLVTVEEAEANYDALMASLRAHTPEDREGLSSDHRDFYDDFGLPK